MKMRRILAPLVLASLFATSCVGPYNAFNSVASWNSRVSDSKFLNELVYLGLYIVPVYPLAAFGDALIFNSFEFWGGENPIKKPEEFTPQGDK
jgi:Domain of unknown function (DUF3332)